MTLHLVNKPPSNPAMSSCLATVLPGDAVLLIEHGVYCAANASFREVTIYALDVDVRARGLDGNIPPEVQLIDDARFVQLACEHNPIVTWA